MNVETQALGHLHPAARAEAALDDEARIRHLHRDRWIDYPRAAQALQHLERLLVLPERQRMPCMVLHGVLGLSVHFGALRVRFDTKSPMDSTACVRADKYFSSCRTTFCKSLSHNKKSAAGAPKCTESPTTPSAVDISMINQRRP